MIYYISLRRGYDLGLMLLTFTLRFVGMTSLYRTVYSLNVAAGVSFCEDLSRNTDFLDMSPPASLDILNCELFFGLGEADILSTLNFLIDDALD